MWYLEVEVVSKINDHLECVDCTPPRYFRNLAGLKGHMQFKHDKTGAYVERPPSKTNAMIQELLDQQRQILDQHYALYELIAEQFDKPIGVFSGGNGNDNLGNNHQGNNNGDQGGDVQEYHCNGCESPIFPRQVRCPSCKTRLNWNGVAVN
jgi:hypothetical protein